MSLSAQQLISFIDLTSLNTTDTAEIIAALCAKAHTSYGDVAAVCIYSQFIAEARKHLNDKIAVATVVNFPEGDKPLSEVLLAIQQVLADGAAEIDVVLPYRQLISGEEQPVLRFIQECREASGSALLKVIIESGALVKHDLIYRASELCIEGQADFIKTSTGKIAVGATPEAVAVIVEAIKKSKSKKTGIKISGGIHSVDVALNYAAQIEKSLGTEWLSPQTFRLGASQLLNKIIALDSL